MIQDEFTGLYYDPTSITNNLIKTNDKIKTKNGAKHIKKGNSNKEKDFTGSILNE